MELHEVYVQGVGRFLTPFKFPLAKGYNVVNGGNETGKSALANILAATFDSQHAATMRASFSPVLPYDGTQRYGALFSHGGRRYRLLRDLNGLVNLAVLNPETRKFDLLANSEDGLLQFFQDELDFPIEGQYKLLALLDRQLAPSGGGAPVAMAQPAAFDTYESQMGLEEAVAEDPLGSAKSPEEKLKVLKHQLHILGSVGEIEFRVDGLQNKRYETEANLTKFREMNDRLKAIAERSEAIRAIETLTPELEHRVQNLDKQEEYHRQRLNQLDDEIKKLESQLDILEPKNAKKFHKDPFFIGGAVAALLGFVLPFFVTEYLVLIGFAAVGWLVYLFFMVYPKVAGELAEINRKHNQKIKEEEKLKADWEKATGTINWLVKTLQTLDAKDLLKIAEEYRAIQQEQKEIEAQREEHAKQVGDEAKLKNDHERQEAEIALFEEELQQAGAITHDENQLRREIELLEAQIASGSADLMAVAASPVHAAATVAAGAGLDIAGLLHTGAEVARKAVEELTQVVGEKFNTYLRALTNGKIGPATLSSDGALAFKQQQLGDLDFELDSLGAGSRDTVLLALRFAILEAVLPSRAFPIVLDDPFALLDEQRQAVGAKAVKRLSGIAQVVHFAPQSHFAQQADHTVALK